MFSSIQIFAGAESSASQNIGSFALTLVQNAALLVALAALHRILDVHLPARGLRYQMFSGLLFGATGIVGMLTPLKFMPGIIYDGRSIVMSVAGLFGGPLVAAIAGLMCIAMRLGIGGPGAWVGVGVIITSGILGVAMRHLRQRKPAVMSFGNLVVFGLVNHLLMLLWQLYLPGGVGPEVLRKIGLIVLVLFTLVNVLICMMFLELENRRKQSQQLRESEERFRTTLQSVGDAVITTDAQGRVTFMNPVAEVLTGWSRVEACGKPLGEVFRIINEDTRLPADNPVQRVLKEGNVIGLANHTVLIAKDGRERPVADSGAPIRDDEGRLSGVVLVFRDQTTERAAQKALQESEAKFRMFAESSLAGIYLYREDCFLYVNKAAAQMFGYAPEEIIGKLGPFDLIHPDEHEMLKENIRLRLSGEVPSIRYELRGRRKDGSTIYVEVHGGRVEFQGKPAIMGVVIDRTERRLMEDKLREQAALLDAASDAICVHELDGTVSYWNQSASRLFGFTPEAAAGKKLWELMPLEKERIESIHRELMENGHSEGEITVKQTNGGELHVLCRWVLVRDAQGKASKIFGIFTDISRQKQLIAQVASLQRREAVGNLAAGIAHDINNVLTPIVLITPMLQQAVNNPELAKLIQTIDSCAKRGAGIIKQLLTFARGQPGSVASLPIRHLLREQERIVRETFPKNIAVSAKAAVNLWTVMGDITQFQQALMNLCINARDAMPMGGKLELSAENVMVDKEDAALTPQARPGPYVKISVQDTGTGIAPKDLEHIFESFYTAKEPGKGTGLGLSTVHGIVHGHGGFIRVNTRLGFGTTFSLYFPAVPEAKESEEQQSETKLPQGNGELLLVVDDEHAVLAVIQQRLEMNGYRVVTACDGIDALRVWRQYRGEIRAVLTDMMMPRMNGIALVETLRTMAPELPIFGMTGIMEQVDMENVAKLKLPAVFSKPFPFSTFLTTLRKHIAGD